MDEHRALAPLPQQTLAEWHRFVAAGNHDLLPPLFSEHIVFRSPFVQSPIPGRTATLLVLGTVVQIFENFLYHREFVAGSHDAALEFFANIGKWQLKGIDWIKFEDSGKMLEFEVRHWITNSEAGIGRGSLTTGIKRFVGRHNSIGNIFYGSKGYLAAGDEDASSYEIFQSNDGKPASHGHGRGNHFANFIDCVRSRKTENLNAPIQEGHISCALVHLANASYRLGRTLQFDPKTERVIADDEANRLLRDGDRGYRAPFVVPEEI